MLHVYNLHVVRTHYTTPSSMFARPGCLELLRVAKLNDQQRSTVLAARDDRVRLLGSRVFRDTGPHSLGAILAKRGCPCGKGRQTVEHVLWECELSSVVTRRATRASADDALALADALDGIDELSSTQACADAERARADAERARADAERALAAHRAAAVEAANAARLSNAADARYRVLDSHAHRVSDFTYFADQHVSGIILDSQRAAVRSHRAQKAAAATRGAPARPKGTIWQARLRRLRANVRSGSATTNR